MNITLIISSLPGGGAERVISNMANYWAAKGWQITLLTFDDGSTPPFYQLNSKIHLIPLRIAGKSNNFLEAFWNTLTRLKILRLKIRSIQPDAVISFISSANVLSLLASRGLSIPVIISERVDPEYETLDLTWSQLRNWTYPYASALVVQTKKIANYFSNLPPTKIQIIPNPVLLSPVTHSFSNYNPHPSLIGIGRLVPQKGFDLLLQAFSQIKQKYPDWTLTILGEGELRQKLEALRDHLGLSEDVFFPGQVKNPHDYLKRADLFVLSSRYEGFPNVLCEAMACGLPVIATNCSSGSIQEIIRHEVDGLLVPNEDVTALASAMDRLMSSQSERHYLANRALEITSRFSQDAVMKQWEYLINQVTIKSLK